MANGGTEGLAGNLKLTPIHRSSVWSCLSTLRDTAMADIFPSHGYKRDTPKTDPSLSPSSLIHSSSENKGETKQRKEKKEYLDF